VYDTFGTDLAASPEADDRRSASRDVNLYDREAFEFHSYAPRVGFFYNRNDGFGLSLGLSSCAKLSQARLQNRYDFNLQTSTSA
jgi:PIN domain nuclease of toxin-antitoxin system